MNSKHDKIKMGTIYMEKLYQNQNASKIKDSQM